MSSHRSTRRRLPSLWPKQRATVAHSILRITGVGNIRPFAAERVKRLLTSSWARPFLGHRVIGNRRRANVPARDIHIMGRAHNRQIRAEPIGRLYRPRPMRMQRLLQLALADREITAKAEAPLRGKRLASTGLLIRAGV